MPEYGLTPTGPNIKRLDVIIDEIHDDLSREWGVNTRQDPQSLLSHLITNIADQLAALWEFGEDVYNSQYPTTAEGTSLDNAAQLGGTSREGAAKSYYHILCTGVDGTAVPADSIIASATNPPVNLRPQSASEITRSAFNQAEVIFAEWRTRAPLSIALNGTLYSVEAEDRKSKRENFENLVKVMKDRDFTYEVTDSSLIIKSVNETANSTMVLSGNLTTQTVTTSIIFGTEEDGDIYLPPGTVTNVVKGPAGLLSVTNAGEYTAGQMVESDQELRRSYVDKIFNRSSNMLESIRSAILQNVQGVTSCTVYENSTNLTDSMGRWPHSVEAVVDGGDQTEIARQILASKAGGISSYGSVEVELPGDYGEPIIIRFNRPSFVYVWFKVKVMLSRTIFPPSNYAEMVKEQILENMEKLQAGESATPQKFMLNVSGIDFMDIWLFHSTEEGKRPEEEEYTERVVSTSPRERAVTDENRIEVELDA